MLDKILKLGHPDLYKVSENVREEEVSGLKSAVDIMAECIIAYREKYGGGGL